MSFHFCLCHEFRCDVRGKIVFFLKTKKHLLEHFEENQENHQIKYRSSTNPQKITPGFKSIKSCIKYAKVFILISTEK